MATRDEVLRELGLAPRWRRRDGAASPAVEPAASIEAPPVTASAPVAQPDAEARKARIATLDWTGFAADVGACTACGLCRTRQRAVPGVGDVDADWLFVGEAPGAEEDA
jgi:DNA polymerase